MNMVLTTIEVKPENMDEFVRIWNEGSTDVKSFEGFKAGYLVTNHDLGKAVIVGLWETAANAAAFSSSTVFQTVMGKLRPLASNQPAREFFEISGQV
ncbi:MAG: antibiotic biosynthesis monooxygenase family protein [Anaerolineales bacterium]